MSALYIGEAIAWIGRAVQLQIAGNFDVFEYRTKLMSPRFFEAVDLYCEPARRYAAVSEQFSNSAAPFEWLTNRDTWLRNGVFADRCASLSNEDCQVLINHFTAACFERGPVYILDLPNELQSEALRKFDETNGPIEGWTVPVMVAIGLLRHRRSACAATFQALWPILDNPRYPTGPGFEAFELWIDRQAAHAVCELFGIEPFAKNEPRIRSELFQYLALIGAIDARDQKYLRDTFLANGKWPNTDFSFEEWLVNGDPYQGLLESFNGPPSFV